MALLANDPILLGRLILSFKHLKHQNLSTGNDFIHGSGIFFSFIFVHQGAVALLANNLIMSGTSIRSFRHLEYQNLSMV